MSLPTALSSKIVIPGLTRNPATFYETLDSCFRRNDLRESADYYETIDNSDRPEPKKQKAKSLTLITADKKL
jgi:hypothetical protein